MQKVEVFLSSTCYDLMDLRAELAQHLKENGFEVRASDDFDLGFENDNAVKFDLTPTGNSIESCLLNVEKSDAVVCVLDREIKDCHAGSGNPSNYGPSPGPPRSGFLQMSRGFSSGGIRGISLDGDHRLAILVHQRSDPTLPYQALVIRESARL